MNNYLNQYIVTSCIEISPRSKYSISATTVGILLFLFSFDLQAQCPVITSQPAINQTVCYQGTQTWNVVVAATGQVYYSWQYTTNGTQWMEAWVLNMTNVDGYNTATLEMRGITNPNVQVRVVVAANGCAVTSNAGALTILPIVPPVTVSSQIIYTVCPQTTTDISSLISSNILPGNSIEWRYYPSNLVVEPTQAGPGIYVPYQYNGTCYSSQSSNSWVNVRKTTCQLPVTLTSFQGEWTSSGTNELSWATTEETSNEYFEIQASNNAKSFETIGRLEGNGTSSLRNGYKFVDQNPSSNLSYYRLKQVDFDGTSSYSKIITVKTGILNDKLVAYPNPATNGITIKLADQIVVESRIIDLLGRPVLTQKTKSKTVQTTGLNPGIYVLEVQTKSGQTYREQFVKQ